MAPAVASNGTYKVTVVIGSWNAVVNGKQGTITSSLIDIVPSNSPAAKWTPGNSRTISVINVPKNGCNVHVSAAFYVKSGLFGTPVLKTINKKIWVNPWDATMHI
jgi:hypothetical protein